MNQFRVAAAARSDLERIWFYIAQDDPAAADKFIHTVQLYIEDPDKRIIDVKFLDGQGHPLKSNQSFSMDNFKSTDFESAPPADTQLSLQIATPESLKTYSFQVENIALP